MDALHKSQLRQKIAVAVQSSITADQSPSFATATQVNARVEPHRKAVVGKDGRQLVTSHLVIVESEIALTSRIWIPPNGDSLPPTAGLAEIPIAVNQIIDENGSTSHWEVLL